MDSILTNTFIWFINGFYLNKEASIMSFSLKIKFKKMVSNSLFKYAPLFICFIFCILFFLYFQMINILALRPKSPAHQIFKIFSKFPNVIGPMDELLQA